MKTNLALFLALTAAAQAGPRTSASYTILTDTTGTGGGKSTSAAYSNTGAAGGIAGTSTVAAPAETAKAGYVAQLTETTGLTLTASPLTVNEGATRQLAAQLVLDDATLLAVPGATVAWSVTTGPLTIASTGLATGGVVLQNTAATAQGIHLGYTASLGLTVVNSLPDNFGTYAGDGLDDNWQNLYFGLNNPLAAPTQDPDGDGQTNLFEFIAGLIPTSPASRFRLTLAPVPGQPTQMRAIFSPLVVGRSYSVEYSTSLTSGTWQPLTGTTFTENGDERTVTDPAATGAKKFYRVNVSKP